jgi:hypothetical protein
MFNEFDIVPIHMYTIWLFELVGIHVHVEIGCNLHYLLLVFSIN